MKLTTGDNGTRKGSTCTSEAEIQAKKFDIKMVNQKHNYNLQAVLGKL